MSKRPSVDALAAAYLAGHGLTQGEIANKLHKSQPTVSRLISEAERAGHLRREALWVPRDLDEATLRAVLARAGRQRLVETLETIRKTRMPNLPIPRVSMFPSGPRDTSSEYRDRLRRFGAEAGAELAKHLAAAKICGVCWGKSVAAGVAGIGLAVSRHDAARRPVKFIPICGEQVGIQPPKVSASMLAGQLAEIWNGDRKAAKSLMGVPAFVTSQLGPECTKALWRWVYSIEAYQEVFGSDPDRPDPRALIERMDMVLVSVGVPGVALGHGLGRYFRKMANVDANRLNQLIRADIGGALITKEGLSAPDQREVDEVSKRWTGVQVRQLRQCADAARKDPKRPGVVVLAVGANKAEMVKRIVLEQRLVNHLIIDDDLEERLIELLDQPTEPARAA